MREWTGISVSDDDDLLVSVCSTKSFRSLDTSESKIVTLVEKSDYDTLLKQAEAMAESLETILVSSKEEDAWNTDICEEVLSSWKKFKGEL